MHGVAGVRKWVLKTMPSAPWAMKFIGGEGEEEELGRELGEKWEWEKGGGSRLRARADLGFGVGWDDDVDVDVVVGGGGG